MIAVMVLGIGLIGVGALVSVGALQAQRASIDDRKAILGQAEARDDVARGFLQAENWLAPTFNSSKPYAQYMQIPSGLQSLEFPALPGFTPSIYSLQPVCIDPMMLSSAAASGATNSFQQNAINYFAFASISGNPPLAMQRLTVNMTSPTWSTQLSQLNPPSAASLQSCISQDDLKFGFTTSTPGDDALPQSFFNSAGTKRTFTGQYSWLMTLVPAYGDVQPIENGNLMTASIVVFNQRQFAISPPADQSTAASSPWTERALQVTSVATGGYGGGSVVLSGSSQAAFNLRVGNVIMLGWLQLDVPSDSSGNPTVASGGATYGTQANPKPARPMFRWYRIINAGPVSGSGSNWTQNVMLSGADLNQGIIVPQSIYAFIYDNAVAVYERTVHLEGPSMWTN